MISMIYLSTIEYLYIYPYSSINDEVHFFALTFQTLTVPSLLPLKKHADLFENIMLFTLSDKTLLKAIKL